MDTGMSIERAKKKIEQAARGQVHQIHKTHWHGVKPRSKKFRRFSYWVGVELRLKQRAGLQGQWFSRFSPRKPRGKRALAFAAFLERQRLADIHFGIVRPTATTKSPVE